MYKYNIYIYIYIIIYIYIYLYGGMSIIYNIYMYIYIIYHVSEPYDSTQTMQYDATRYNANGCDTSLPRMVMNLGRCFEVMTFTVGLKPLIRTTRLRWL